MSRNPMDDLIEGMQRMGKFNLLGLPDKIIARTLSFLPIADRMKLRVCKRLDTIELESPYHVDRLRIEEKSINEADDPNVCDLYAGDQKIIFYKEKSYSSESIRRLAHNASIGRFSIELSGSEKFHCEVYDLIKEFNIEVVELSFEGSARQILMGLFFIDLARHSKWISMRKGWEMVTADDLCDSYKIMVEGSGPLRIIQSGIRKETCISFLDLIGISYKNGFFSNREVDIYEDGVHKFIFDGNIQIVLNCDIFDGAKGELGGLLLQLHETRESIEHAKMISRPFNFLGLPDKIIARVLSFLPIADRMRVRVCKRLDTIELESTYHVKDLLIDEKPISTRLEEHWNPFAQVVRFYEENSNSADCIKRIARNTSIRSLTIKLSGSDDFHREVYDLIKDFNFKWLTVKFKSLELAHDVWMNSLSSLDSVRLEMTTVSIKEYATSDRLDEIYKVVMESTARLPSIQLSVVMDECISFLSLIGITFKLGEGFFSKRDIEMYSSDWSMYIFDGNLEISLSDVIFDDTYGADGERGPITFEFHETRDSLEKAKNREGLEKIEFGAEPSVYTARVAEILASEEGGECTTEHLHDLYKVFIDSPVRLRKVHLHVGQKTCLSFLTLIGITHRGGRFFSKRDVEMFDADEDVHIFDGNIEIRVGNQVFEDESHYPIRAFVKFERHANRESLDNAKKREDLESITFGAEPSVSSARIAEILASRDKGREHTTEHLLELYMVFIDSPVRLRKLRLHVAQKTCLSFLTLIGITHKDDQFFSKRDVEMFAADENVFIFDGCVHIFDGNVEIQVNNRVFEDESNYPIRAFVKFERHANRESLDKAKKRDNMNRINYIAE